MDAICYDDLDPLGRETSDPLVELEQDVVHVLLEPIGSNLDDVNRGVGLEDELSGTEGAFVGSRIDAGLLKDDRIAGTNTVVEALAGGINRIALDIEADEGALGVTLEAAPDGSVRRVS